MKVYIERGYPKGIGCAGVESVSRRRGSIERHRQRQLWVRSAGAFPFACILPVWARARSLARLGVREGRSASHLLFWEKKKKSSSFFHLDGVASCFALLEKNLIFLSPPTTSTTTSMKNPLDLSLFPFCILVQSENNEIGKKKRANPFSQWRRILFIYIRKGQVI